MDAGPRKLVLALNLGSMHTTSKTSPRLSETMPLRRRDTGIVDRPGGGVKASNLVNQNMSRSWEAKCPTQRLDPDRQDDSGVAAN